MRRFFLTLLVILFASCAAKRCCAQGPTVVHVFPDQAGTNTGEIRFYETNAWATGGGVNYVGWKAPTGDITANAVFTLPIAFPADTRCIEITAGGVMQYAAGTCGTGTSFYNTMRDNGVNMTQRAALNFVSASMVLTDDSGNDETEFTLTTSPANAATLVGTGRLISTTSPITGGGDLSADRTIACATCVTTDTTQTISGLKTFTNATEFDGTVRIDENLDIRNSSGSLMARIKAPGAANTISIENSTGTQYARFDATNEIMTLGVAASPWTINLEGDAIVRGSIRPTGSGTRDIGSTLSPWDRLWLSNQIEINSAPVLNTGTWSGATVLQTNAFAITSGGSFYTRTFSAADVDCTGVSDGWFGYRLDTDEIQICDGGAMRKVALAP